MNFSRGKDRGRSLLVVVLRALGSTLAVGAVALAAVCWRLGRFRWSEAQKLIAENWTFLGLVFGGIAIWDFWTEKTKRGRSWERGPDG